MILSKCVNFHYGYFLVYIQEIFGILSVKWYKKFPENSYSNCTKLAFYSSREGNCDKGFRLKIIFGRHIYFQKFLQHPLEVHLVDLRLEPHLVLSQATLIHFQVVLDPLPNLTKMTILLTVMKKVRLFSLVDLKQVDNKF